MTTKSQSIINKKPFVAALINKILNHLWKNLWFILCIYIILPFIVLFFFTQPVGDDFCFSADYIEKGFLGALKNHLVSFGGRYSAYAINLLNPMSFHSIVLYRLVLVVIFIFLLFSLHLFFHRVFGLSRKKAILFALSFFSLYLIQLPSPQQGLYWYPGATTYTLPLSLILLLFLIIYSVKGKIVSFILVPIMIIIIVGIGELAILSMIYFLLIALAIKLYFNEKDKWKLVLYVVFAGIFVGFYYMAPGNYTRVDSINNLNSQNFIFTLITSLKQSVIFPVSWLQNLAIIICTIFFIPAAYKNAKHLFPFKFHPLVYILFSYFFLICLFLPINWAVGNAFLPTRYLNFVYFWFILLWFINVQIVVSYFYQLGYNNFYLPGIVKFFLFIGLLFIIKDYRVRTAYNDLFSGSAYRYNKELNERYKVIESCTNDTCYVLPLIECPQSICGDDIKEETNDWRNKCYDSYFNKNVMRIQQK